MTLYFMTRRGLATVLSAGGVGNRVGNFIRVAAGLRAIPAAGRHFPSPCLREIQSPIPSKDIQYPSPRRFGLMQSPSVGCVGLKAIPGLQQSEMFFSSQPESQQIKETPPTLGEINANLNAVHLDIRTKLKEIIYLLKEKNEGKKDGKEDGKKKVLGSVTKVGLVSALGPMVKFIKDLFEQS